MSHANIIDILTEGATEDEKTRITVRRILNRQPTVVIDSIGSAVSNMGEAVQSFSNNLGEAAQAFRKLAEDLLKKTSPKRKRGKRRRGPPPRHVSKVSPKRGRR